MLAERQGLFVVMFVEVAIVAINGAINLALLIMIFVNIRITSLLDLE